jgi:hypothetical protein
VDTFGIGCDMAPQRTDIVLLLLKGLLMAVGLQTYIMPVILPPALLNSSISILGKGYPPLPNLLSLGLQNFVATLLVSVMPQTWLQTVSMTRSL